MKNGLRLVTVALPVKSMTVEINVASGSRYETNANNGISHFAEHLFFKGTKKRPTARDISTEVDSFGAVMNAGTGKEQTSFFIKAGVQHLEKSLAILTDILRNSKFDPKEIDKERGVILEEISMYEDLPMEKVDEVFESLLYSPGPLGRRIIGKRSNIRQLRRQDFLDYLERFYRLKRIVVSIAGGIEGKTDKIELVLRNWPGVAKAAAEKIPEPRQKIKSSTSRPRLKIEFKKTEQAHFCLGVPTFKRSHPDRYVLSVLATILGGGMSSRLFEEVRERRGLAYYVRTSLGHFRETGHLVTQVGTDPRKIDQAIKVILTEYQKIGRDQSEMILDELKKAKEYLKGHLILSLEDSHAVAGLCGRSLLLDGRVRMPEEIIAGIDKVSLADIQRVSRAIFLTRNLNLAIVGPYKDEARFVKSLASF